MYRCKYFKIEELVSRKAFEHHGDKCWRFLDPAMLRGLDDCRKRYGKIHVNTWLWGGPMEYRGLRLPGELSGSSDFSAHRHGKAVDIELLEVTPEYLRQEILSGRWQPPGLTELELATPTWVHMAFSTNVDPLLTFYP